MRLGAVVLGCRSHKQRKIKMTVFIKTNMISFSFRFDSYKYYFDLERWGSLLASELPPPHNHEG